MAIHVTLYRYMDEGIKGIKGIKNAADIARGWQQEAQQSSHHLNHRNS